MDDDKGRFGFEPEDFEHVIRDATEGLREALGGFGRFFTMPNERAGWSSVFEDLSRRTRTRPETAGEAGDGVWAIYVVSADGGARVEEVYASELEALAGEPEQHRRHPQSPIPALRHRGQCPRRLRRDVLGRCAGRPPPLITGCGTFAFFTTQW